MAKGKAFDSRPICDCLAYSFPHRIGGRCRGNAFTEFHFQQVKSECEFCNCNAGDRCDVSTGREPIGEAECYRAAWHCSPGEHLPIEFVEPER